GNFKDNLVGFEVHQVFIPLHPIARFFVPAHDGGLGDGLWQCRYFDFDAHRLLASLSGSASRLALKYFVNPASRSATRRRRTSAQCIIDQLPLLLVMQLGIADSRRGRSFTSRIA